MPNSYTVPALAPAFEENICPHCKLQMSAGVFVTDEQPTGAERWEIRTRPLGCQVSTITSLTSLISIASTIAFIGIIAGLVLAAKRLRRYRQQRDAGQWHFWKHRWTSRGSSGLLPSSDHDDGHVEEEPLLGARRSSSSRSYDSEHGAGGHTQTHRQQDAQSRSRTAAWSPEISPKTSPTRQPELTGGIRATSSYS